MLENPEKYGLQKVDGKEYHSPECGTTAGALSEDDEKELDCIINILDRLGFEEFCKSSRDQDIEEERFYYKEIKFLKRLKDLRHWKPSEQEKGALRTAIHVLIEERNFPKAAEQLENILNAFEGEKPRKVWKPTERQLNKLYRIAYGIPDDDDAKVLMEILEGISKL